MYYFSSPKLAMLLINIIKFGIVQFLLCEYLETNLCVYSKHSMLIIILHEKQAYKFVKLSDLTKIGIFAHI